MTAVAVQPGEAYALRLLDARSRKAEAAAQVAAWLTHLQARERAPGTVKAYSYRADKLLAMFPETAFEDFTEAHLVTVLTAIPRESKREYITAFVSLFRTWAFNRDLIARDPTKLLHESFRPRKQKHIDVFTEGEVEALLGLPNDEAEGTGSGEDGFRMLLMLDTGLRISELCNLRVRDVQPDRGQLLVFKGKGDKDRVVPMTRRLVAAFAWWQLTTGAKRDEYVLGHGYSGRKRGIKHRETPLSTDALRMFWWRNALACAGVPYRTPHVTRHTMATRMIRAGAAYPLVSKILGHTSIDTTIRIYTHLVTADLAEAIGLLER